MPNEAAGSLMVVPTATLTPSMPQWIRAAPQAVVEEAEEKVNKRLQLIVALLNESASERESPVVHAGDALAGRGHQGAHDQSMRLRCGRCVQ